MQISAHEAEIRDLVGADLFRRAVGYARDGAVLGLRVDESGDTLAAQVRGTARTPYKTRVFLTREPGGELIDFLGVCSCPVGADCKHAVALLLAGPQPTARSTARPSDAGAANWRAALDSLLGHDRADEAASPAVALQFEHTGFGPEGGVTIRPVLRGANGNWVRSGISWSNLDAIRFAPRAREFHRLLAELSALYSVAQTGYGYFYGRPGALALGEFGSRRVWDVLAEARASGLPFVSARTSAGPVTLHEQPVTVELDVRRCARGLEVGPRMSLAGEAVPPRHLLVLGAPAHGVMWTHDNTPNAPVQLARLEAPGLDVRELLNRGSVRVPSGEVEEFLTSYAVPLHDSLELVSSDDSVALPRLGTPTLRLALDHRPGRLRLEWAWHYDSGFAVPIDEGTGRRLRDDAAEQSIIRSAAAACAGVPSVCCGSNLAPTARLEGVDVVRFATDVLPALVAVPGLQVELTGAPLDFREAIDAPQIEFVAAEATGEDQPGARDWLDLEVNVSVAGEPVTFAELFRALAAGEDVLILPSGTWLRLDRPEFAELVELIAESRALHDAEPNGLRLSRYQADVWGELERLGTVRGQAATWHAALGGLLRSASNDHAPTALPAGVTATLRPYQAVGIGWLVHLFEHGLGGVLADEMGLGKTIQCLGLFCHARERDPGGAAFLVVAPTSVVSNWASEAARFAPGLQVVALTETARRRRRPLTELAAGADVVVTSYTLFRIDQDEYGAVPWAGLVLDEAQFVKNHRSQSFSCAKKLATPFKLAITGTPMENNLMELWAMFALAAPGLFPSPRAFERYYRTGIERGRDAALVTQLRRRIRPFLLRRTKSEVLADLPAKQEQVLELDLDPRHRRAYQTLLARERRKVLGLLGDLDRNQFEILRSLTLLRQASLDVSLADPQQSAVPSTKLDELMRMVTEIAAEGHRVVVFSQFTRFLAKVRSRLDDAGVAHCYLDGRTRRRADAIASFKGGAAPVFLISLKAGGVGLNLTEADYCILLDPWWNAAAEAQAVDRVHRIGQTRKVTVYRLVARDTIEQKVMAVKAGKAALFAGVLDGGDWTGAKLSAAEIRELLA